jgi:DNA-binding transcriptional LysR family regulator
MELRQLRGFLAVVTEQHFGRAAGALHLSQPALSRQISALEQEVGCRLLDRSGRRVELTEAGRAFSEHARIAVAAAADAEAAVRSLSGRPGLTLRVGLFASGNPPMANEIVRILRGNAEVLLAADGGSSERHLEALRHHRIDAAFLIAPTDPPDDLVVQTVHRERIVVAIPSGHELAERADVSAADLRDKPLVARRLQGAPTQLDAVLASFGASRLVPERRGVDLMEAEARLDAVAYGMGCTLVLESAARKFDVGGVVYRPLVPPTFVDCVVAWLAAAADLPAMRRMAAAVDAALGARARDGRPGA